MMRETLPTLRARMAPRVAELKLGDHVCAFYETPLQRTALIVEYVTQGRERGERCLYVCDDCRIEDFRAALSNAGLDVEAEERDASLIVLTKGEAHLKNGRFDAEVMLDLLNRAVEQALNDGYNGLRAGGEMTWLLDEAPGTEHAAEYEALLTPFDASVRALGLCMYSRSRIPPHFLENAICTHPRAFVGDVLCPNLFFEPSSVLTGATTRARVDSKLAALVRSADHR